MQSIFGIAAFLLFAAMVPVMAASPASVTSQCMASMRTELDRITAEIKGVDDEPDISTSGISGNSPMLVAPGECARVLAIADGFRAAITVRPSEVDRMERRACLQLDFERIGKMCECAWTGDTSLPNNKAIQDSKDAASKFEKIKARVMKFGIQKEEIRTFVEMGQQVAGCWGDKTADLLNRVTAQIDRDAFAAGSASVSPTSGSTASVSAIDGGMPSVAPIDAGPQIAAPSPIPRGYTAPPSSDISGTTNATTSPTTSGSTDYRTSGAGTSAAKDVIDFANAYNKSASSLDSIRPSPPPKPQVHASPAPTPQVYRGSGISGRSH